MIKIAILDTLQQQAEALGTQFPPVYAFYNEKSWNTNIKEMNSNDHVIYRSYRASGIKQETVELLRLIKETMPDVIYINGLRLLLVMGLFIRISHLFSDRPVVIATSHNSTAWKRPLKRRLITVLLNSMADGILSLARFQEQWLIKYGVSPRKIRTIPNPVDIDQFSPEISESHDFSHGSPVLINVGELNPLKNQETLIKAVSLLKMEFPNIRLILTGGRVPNPEYSKFIENLIADCQVRENVNIVGYHVHRQVPQLLNSADISLVSSLSEACPFIVLESLAASKVTIATSVGGIPDLITSGFNGFLIEPGNANGFADCICKVLNDSPLRISIEENARKTAEANFSYQAVGVKHKEFIFSLLHNKRN